MAKPTTADIEATYAAAEAAGLTRDEVDTIAIPLISTLGGASSLGNVRSHGELRTIAAAVADEANRRKTASAGGPAATARQVDYIAALGGDPATAATMTRREASAHIDDLKAGRSATTARAAGRRHGVSGEIWD